MWLEPGRYVVSQAGVLVAEVTQLKGKGAVQYVGVATGMNSLLRPALYGAHHDIVNLSRIGEPGTEVYRGSGRSAISDHFGHDGRCRRRRKATCCSSRTLGLRRGDEFVVHRGNRASTGVTLRIES